MRVSKAESGKKDSSFVAGLDRPDLVAWLELFINDDDLFTDVLAVGGREHRCSMRMVGSLSVEVARR